MRVTGWQPRRRRSDAARASSRGPIRVAALAVTVAAVGATGGSASAVGVAGRSVSAAGQQAVNVTLGYSCAFRSGTRPVSVRLTAAFPVTAKAGQAVRPTRTSITVTLPHPAVTELTRLHASAVTLTAGLATQTTESGQAASAIWPDFKSPVATVPATGPLTF